MTSSLLRIYGLKNNPTLLLFRVTLDLVQVREECLAKPLEAAHLTFTPISMQKLLSNLTNSNSNFSLINRINSNNKSHKVQQLPLMHLNLLLLMKNVPLLTKLMRN